jgi:branched-chain amino acid transport system permease protein
MSVRRLIVSGLALAAATAPAFMTEFQLIQMNYIGMGALIALGLVMLTGVAGVMSFGQQVFAGIAAYATAVLTLQYGASAWTGLIAGLLIVVLVSVFLGLITLRLSGHFMPIATLSWGLAIYFVFGNLDVLGKHTGLSNVPPISIGDIALNRPGLAYYLIWIVLIAALVACSNLLDSRSGRAIRALRARAAMAESFGVNVAQMKLAVFVLAALLAALSGWFYAHVMGFVSPTAFNVQAGIDYLFMAVLGGAASVWGALAGAGILTVVKIHLAGWMPAGAGTSGNFEIVVLGLLFLLVLHRAPRGLSPLLAGWLPAGPRPRAVPVSHVQPLARRAMPSEPTVLTVSGVTKRFGGLVAVNNLSFDVRRGEVTGLIGPNGAGKSTMFNLISGALPRDAGEVRYRGERIDGLSPARIAQRGIARTFQHVNLLGRLSVLENVAMGAHLRGRCGMLASMLRADREEERRLLAEAMRQIERVGLAQQMHAVAGSLPLGQQRLVEIARALCADPGLLLLDEPAAGLRYGEKQELARLIAELRTEGLSILLVEHDMDFLMGLADRIVVMQFGQLLTTGTPDEVRVNPAVIEAYLGAE